MKLTIGADPEVFVLDRDTNKFVSAHDLVPGSKYRPYATPNGAIQPDGVAAEFNIHPASTRKEFLSYLARTEKVLKMVVRKDHESYDLIAVPTADFDPEYFSDLPEYAKALGCDPDFDAYLEQANPKPSGDRPFRTGAGHIHIGFCPPKDNPMEEHHFKNCCSLTKQLDAILVPASKLWDSDTKRMELYGKPGAFRPKPYGLEYRVLSNAWLTRNSTKSYVYDATKAVTALWLKGINVVSAARENGVNLQKAPANSDEVVNFCKRIGVPAITDFVT